MFITILFPRPIFSARFTNAFRRNAVKRGRNVGYHLVKRVIMQVRDRSILLCKAPDYVDKWICGYRLVKRVIM